MQNCFSFIMWILIPTLISTSKNIKKKHYVKGKIFFLF